MSIRCGMSDPLNSAAPFVSTSFAERFPKLSQEASGALMLTCGHPPGAAEPHMGHHLRRWAASTPDRTFLAERGADGRWEVTTYEEARRSVDRLSQGLIELGLAAHRPVAFLADNSVRYALLKAAAMQVGITVMPISVAYARADGDQQRLRSILALGQPGAVYVPSLSAAARAIEGCVPSDATLICDSLESEGSQIREALTGHRLLDFARLGEAEPGAEVERRFAAVGPASVAKLLMTSGSTGMPKAVIVTEGMIAANGAGVDALWPFLRERPPVIVDWLPWSHTFGTNFNLTLVLRHGGALYIDEGKPVPGLFDASLRNLASVQPTLLVNVPRGFEMLATALEAEDALAQQVLGSLDAIFYAGAALTPAVWGRLEALCTASVGRRVPILSSLGSTETGPVATLTHWCADTPNSIGLPLPGTEIRLVPADDKIEMRVRGPSVTPGYWRAPEATAAAFDEQGFFRLGDAVRAVGGDVANGLMFDGRLSENFKLQSGTWVDVGGLRAMVLDRLRPHVRDLVVAGHDRDAIRLILILERPGEPWDTRLTAEIAARLAAHNAENPRSSRRIAGAVRITVPLSIDTGEITDKGYVNQRAVLSNHADLVERLYDDRNPDVVRPGPAQ